MVYVSNSDLIFKYNQLIDRYIYDIDNNKIDDIFIALNNIINFIENNKEFISNNDKNRNIFCKHIDNAKEKNITLYDCLIIYYTKNQADFIILRSFHYNENNLENIVFGMIKDFKTVKITGNDSFNINIIPQLIYTIFTKKDVIIDNEFNNKYKIINYFINNYFNNNCSNIHYKMKELFILINSNYVFNKYLYNSEIFQNTFYRQIMSI